MLINNPSPGKIHTRRPIFLQLIFVTLAFTLMVVSSALFVNNMLMNLLKRNAEHTLEQMRLMIIAELQEPRTLMISLTNEVRNIIKNGGDADDIRLYVDSISDQLLEKENGFFYNGIYIYLESTGEHFFSFGFLPSADFEITNSPWYDTALEANGDIAMTPVYLGQRNNRYQTSYARRLFDDDGNPLAFVSMNVPLDNISDFVINTSLTENGYGFLANEEFILIAHPETDYINRHMNEISSGFREIVTNLEDGTVVYALSSKNYQNIDSVFYSCQIENGWYLGVVTPRGEYYGDYKTLIIFIGGLGFVLMAAMYVILIRIDKDRNKAEKTYHEQSTQLAVNLKNILDCLDAMIYVTNPTTGEILFINTSMKQHYGIEGDCTGQICYKVLQKDRNDRCELCPCFKLDKEPDKTVIWEEHSDLTNRIYRNVDRYISWPNGQTVHMQYSVDMTELIAAREIAEQSSRYKTAFLATMSHEIRTPMNAILGITEIQMRNENISKQTEEAFEKIYESGIMLLNIINDILDLSKIEAGKFELIPVKYDIPSLINDTVQLNRMKYESKPIAFTIDVDKNMPYELIGDELRIKQILNNILSNAFKYSEEGEIVLSVFPEDYKEKGENVMIVFRVSDTGQGMTEDQIKKLFDEYSRFNIETNRTTIGTGLGMNITKRLVEMMNGRISVESTPGKGSVFTVRVPQKRFGLQVCGAEITEKLNKFNFHSTSIMQKTQFIREYMPYGSVLIVDDVESNIYVAKGMLTPYGLHIETASSGFEAIEKIKNGSVYDIIFMDHMMPKMDGMEAVKIIRSMGYKKYIIALTANAIAGQSGIFLENGFDGYISKPIDSRELNLFLNVFIRDEKPPEVIEAVRHRQQVQKVKVVEKNIKTTEVEKFFVRDAEKTVDVLKNIYAKLLDERISSTNIKEQENQSLTEQKPRLLEENDFQMYIITVHGIKTALANIGESLLSGVALRLEKAGHDKDLAVIFNETPAFIDSLLSLIAKLRPAEDDSSEESKIEEISAEEKIYLREKLKEIKEACDVFDKKAVKASLNNLKEKNWPNNVKKKLDDISVHILHSEFEKAGIIAGDAANEI